MAGGKAKTAVDGTPEERAGEIVGRLTREFPRARTALAHEDPFQLLVATILSAQCTDERVNKVTPALFRKYPGPENFARAALPEIEAMIRSTGFFHAKAKNIKGCCAALVRDHGGKVPADINELVKLPGVGRKTANVVLGSAFGIASGVVVDTHVKRLAGRLGLSKQETPEKIEEDLMKILPQSGWIAFSHLLIWHGRKTCTARKPACPACVLGDLCPSCGKA
jgi:endonuclease-3